MDTFDFLKAVWPATGIYALATPFRPPGALKPVYKHRVFRSIKAAAAEAQRLSGQVDVYFAVHTLREERVWNPLKPNAATGDLGAFEVRAHSNMCAARVFFLDLDVDPNDSRKFPSAEIAEEALYAFCARTKLPLPMVVASGVGLHVYWRLNQEIESQTWRRIASLLRMLAVKLDLKIDPARTTDISSVLRVAGTLHLKDRSSPRPVRVLDAAAEHTGGEFLRALKDACIAAGVKVSAPIRAPLHDNDPMPDLGENLSKIQGDRPPPTMRAVLDACAVMRHVHNEQSAVSEPLWFHALNIVRFAEDPQTWAHRISEGHPGYTHDETETKYARVLASGTGPTSCGVLASHAGEAKCQGCRFLGRVKNPIMAARMVDEAPPPAAPATLVMGDDDDTFVAAPALPNPPKPYRRTRDGGVVMDVSDKEGDDVTVVVYEHDLHPLKRVTNSLEGTEQQMWRVVLPREGAKDFALDADALYDQRKLMVSLANHGVYPHPNNIPAMRDYMIAYIATLQKAADAEEQCNHLGWSDDYKSFVLPTGAMHIDGSTRVVSLSKQAERVSVNITRAGTLEKQIENLHFYDNEAYLPWQFYIMGGLAAPLLHMTGHAGAVENLMGTAGISKSSANSTAASFWGHPRRYPINGTNNGATMKGRNERVATLANLPVCVDEVTHLSTKEATDLAMGISQPGHRIRLDVTGVERAASGGHKSTIMLTTSNSSLHTALSQDNTSGTAGSMRIFEILLSPPNVHAKWEADEFLLRLEENHGHIGEVFIRFVLANYAKVHERVRKTMRLIDERAAVAPSERFWSAVIAATVVAASISRKLGLTVWSPEAMLNWAITQQIPAMRGNVAEEYVDPVNSLTNYLADIHGSTIVVDSSRKDPMPATSINAGRPQIFVKVAPRTNALLAQYDISTQTIWMSHKGFKDYCRKQGAHWQAVMLRLQRRDPDGKSIIIGRARKTLGAYTDHGKAAVDTYIIDAEHPAIAADLIPRWNHLTETNHDNNGNPKVVPIRRDMAMGG
jgi:hypothetical protein